MENNQSTADRGKRVKVSLENESLRPAVLVPLFVEISSNEPDLVEEDVEDIIGEGEYKIFEATSFISTQVYVKKPGTEFRFLECRSQSITLKLQAAVGRIWTFRP